MVESTLKRIESEADVLFDRPVDGRRLAGLRKRYADRPVEFLTEQLGVDYLAPFQVDLLHAIQGKKNVAVVSANSMGKSWLVARAALWFLYTRKDALVITLGPGERQLKLVLWKEIRDALLRARDLPGKLHQSLELGLVISDKHRLYGFSTSPSSGLPEGKITGAHAANMLVVVEEAHAVEPYVWDGIARLALNDETGRLVAIGNAGEPVGGWYERHRGAPDNGWVSIALSAYDHPNVKGRLVVPDAVTLGWIAEVARVYGEDSAFYKSAVLGQFAHGAPDILIPAELWARADALWREERDVFEGEAREFVPVAGWDIAAEAGTNSIAVVQGPICRGIETWREPDLGKSIDVMRKILRRRFQLKKEWERDSQSDYGFIAGGWRQHFHLIYDAVGAGWGAGGLLRERGWSAIPFKGSHAPDQHDGIRAFANARTESWWAVRDALMRGRLAVEYDDELVAQSQIRFSENLQGAIELEPKRTFSQRAGIASPDRMDALAMAVHFTMTKRPAAFREPVYY